MSQVNTKLDLSGISLQKFASKRSARPLPKQQFKITTTPTVVVESTNLCSSKVCFGIILMTIVVIAMFSVITSSSSSIDSVSYVSAQPVKQLSGGLRKIIRMQCTHDSSTHCSSKNDGGEYVVNIKSCLVYDFNGIPFTDIYRDEQQNWHVPPSSDMTLIVNKACKDITATFDTNTKYLQTYAIKNSQGKYIKKIVWIPVENCYTEFNLMIGSHNVLEGTPATMITQKKLNGVVAYIYNVDGMIEGSISVTGKGCKKPIHIYSEKN
jgi:hypothetical protein